MLVLMGAGTVILFCTSIYNMAAISHKRVKVLIMGIIMTIIALLLLPFGEELSIIPFAMIPIIIINIKEKNIMRNCINVIMADVLTVAADFISGNIFERLTGYGKEEIRASLVIYIIYIIITWVIIYKASKLLSVYYGKINKLNNNTSILFFISLILTLVIFYINVHMDSADLDNTRLLLLKSLIFGAYFIMIMIILYISRKNTKNEWIIRNKEVSFKQLQMYTDDLEKLYSSMRAFRHDYVNILLSMSYYIKMDDMIGLEKYFSDKIYPMSDNFEKKSVELAILHNLKIPELKGILYIKLMRAQELGINVSIEMAEPIDRINIDLVDLSRVIGILLDNAVEASQEMHNAYINLAIIDNGNSILIIIVNNFKGKVTIAKIFDKGFSTKGEERGMGLNNLKIIMDKYPNAYLETTAEDNVFKQIIDVNN